jgi:hypothetical protein
MGEFASRIIGAVWPIGKVALSVVIRVNPWLTDVPWEPPRQAATSIAPGLNSAATPRRKTTWNFTALVAKECALERWQLAPQRLSALFFEARG